MSGKRCAFASLSSVCAVAGLALSGTVRADADVVIVSNVKVTGIPAPKSPPPPASGNSSTAAGAAGAPSAPAPDSASSQRTVPSQTAAAPTEIDRTYLTYYKGSKARRESGDGSSIVIYDKEADKVYTIDPRSKTYYMSSFKELMNNGAGLPDSVASRAELTTSVDLDDATADSDGKRTIAGKEAEKLTLFGSVSAMPKAAEGRGGGGFGGFPGGGGGGGGRRRGGGGGGGGGNGGGSAPPSSRGGGSHFAHVTLSGSVWAMDAAALLPNGKKDEKEMSIAILQQELPDASADLKPFADQMAKKKLIPMASRISLRTYSGSGQTVYYDPNGTGSTLSVPDTTEPLVVQMEVKSIDTSATLGDDLFKLPAGYDRVDPPQPVSAIPPAAS